MDNLDVARTLHEIADLLDLRGDEPFKIRAYRQAARTVETLLEDIGAVHRRGDLGRLSGFGKALTEKVGELLATGRLEYLETLRASIPPGVAEMTQVRGLGGRTAAMLHARLGISSLEELELAARQGRLRDLPGFGVRKEAAVLDALSALRRRAVAAPAYVLWDLAGALARCLERVPGVAAVAVAGDLRRMAATATELVLVAGCADPTAALAALPACGAVRDLTDSTETAWPGTAGARQIRARCLTPQGRPAAVWLVPPAGFAAALHAATGSDGHRAALAERARAEGLALHEWGLADAGGAALPVGEEADIYRCLGLPYIPPELREDTGEVAAAAAGLLPELLRKEDLQGDLHTHSRWSDGTATILEMAEAARAMGHRYLAVTDHSQSLRVAGGLTPEQLERQWQEIDRVSRSLGGIRILKGIEVDILKDGRLDLPDTVLAQLDVVVASIHSHMGLSAEDQTRRLEAAIRNPHVDIIGHPTGRRLGYRDGYEMDLERVFRLAAATGTALEMSSSPARLDLDGALARLARSRGVRLAISTDAHAPGELAGLPWGVGQARRAGLAAGDIINALAPDDLLAWLQRPKG